MASTLPLTIRLKVDGSGQVTGELSKIDQRLGGIGKSGATAAGGADQLGGALQRVVGLGAGLFAGSQLLNYGQQLIGVADRMAALSGRLRLATASQTEFNVAQAELGRIAQDNGAPLAETVALYARMAPGLQQLGANQAQLLATTQILSQALALSGASAAESGASMTQFAQAMGSGVVRGDEFNSLMEQAPRLMQAVAAGLDAPIAKLRSMAEAGELTADKVLGALISQKDKLAAEYESLPATVSRSMQQVANAAATEIDKINQAAGATVSIAEALQALARNMGAVFTAAEPVVKVLAALAALKVATWALGAVAGLQVLGGLMGWLRVQVLATALAMSTSGVGGALALGVGYQGLGVAATTAAGGVALLSAALKTVFLLYAGYEIAKYFAENFLGVRVAIVAVIDTAQRGWEAIRYGAEVLWLSVEAIWQGGINTLKGYWASLISTLAAGADAVGAGGLAEKLRGQLAGLIPEQGAYKAALAAAGQAHQDTVAQITAQNEAVVTVMVEEVAGLGVTSRRALGDVNQALKETGDTGAEAAKAAAAAAKEAKKAAADLERTVQGLIDKTDPLGAQERQLTAGIETLSKALVIDTQRTAELTRARSALQAQLEALRNPLTAITQAHTKNVVQLTAELAAIRAGEGPYKQYLVSKKVEEESQRIINDQLAKGYDLRNINTQAITDQVREEQSLRTQIDAEKEARSAANDAWEAFVTEVLGAFVNATGSMGDAFSSLISRMKQEVLNAGVGALFGFKTASTPLLSGVGRLLGIGGAAAGASGAQAAGGGAASPSSLSLLFKGGSLFPGLESNVFAQLGRLAGQPGILGDVGTLLSNSAGSLAQAPGGLVGGGLISAGAGFIGGQLGGAVFGGQPGLGSQLGGIGGGIAGAATLGSLGWAAGPLGALAGSFVGAALDSVIGGDGPETRAAVFAGADTSRAEVKHTVADITAASGLALAGEAQRVGDEGRKAVAGMVDAFAALDATLTQLSRAAGLSVDLSGVKNFGAGQFSAADMAGAGRDFVRAWIAAVSEPFDAELQAAARDLVGNTAEELVNAYQSLLTIRDSIATGGIFAGLGSLQQISQAVAPAEVQRIAAFGAQLKALQATMGTDRVAAWEQSQRSVFALWRDQGDAIVSAAEVAASSEDFAVLTAAVQERYATEQQLIGQIMGALQTAADQFGQSYETIFVDGLKTEQERYNYFRAQADAIAKTIQVLNDPAAISAAAGEYNQALMAAYNALSAESRDAMRADILATTDAVGDLVNERLNAALASINADSNAAVPGSVGNAVEAAVAAAVGDLQKAVTDAIAALVAQQQSTADADADNTAAFGGWVQKLPSSIAVNVAVPRGAEVTFA